MKTAIEIRTAIEKGEVKAVDVIKETLAKIKEQDGDIGAFLETFDDDALAAAEKIDAMVAAGESLPRLAGVPVAIKDNMCYKGHMASAGAAILSAHKAAYTSTAVQRLIDAGAIIVGRANMDDAAMGSSTETSHYQKTYNPWDTTRIPGGSSGGSAAAVAAGFVPVALGSDTGGSIRQPAGMCGVVGLKPTYGRVSRYGLIALASSLDQIGPIAHTVEDAALVLEVIEGKDPLDGTSEELEETTVPELLPKTLEGVKVGVPKEAFIDGMEPEVEARVREAFNVLEKLGAEMIEVSLPLSPYALPAYYIIQPAEASSNLARYDGLRYSNRAGDGTLKDTYLKTRGAGFGKEVKRRILLGTYILSAGYYDAYYKKAQAVRTALFDEMQSVMQQVDVLAMPTSPAVAWKLGERMDDPVQMYLADVLTVNANITGAPAISVPCGFADGLPVGLQFTAGHMEDAKVLQAAAAYQSATDWHKKYPERS